MGSTKKYPRKKNAIEHISECLRTQPESLSGQVFEDEEGNEVLPGKDGTIIDRQIMATRL